MMPQSMLSCCRYSSAVQATSVVIVVYIATFLPSCGFIRMRKFPCICPSHYYAFLKVSNHLQCSHDGTNKEKSNCWCVGNSSSSVGRWSARGSRWCVRSWSGAVRRA